MRKYLVVLIVTCIAGLTPAYTLSLDDVIESVGNTNEVLSAEFALQAAIRARDAARYPGDISATVQPTVTSITPAGGSFADAVTVGGSISLNLPIALSVTRKAAFENAQIAVIQAQRALDVARQSALVTIFAAYADAWSAQAELSVLELELEAARATLEAKRLLFDSGRISLAELTRFEEELSERESVLLDGRIAERIFWLSVAYAVNIDPIETLELEAPVLAVGDLPKPPELTEWAFESNPTVLAQREKIFRLESELWQIRPVDISATVRTNVSAYSHNASISYNLDTPSIAATYSFPVYTFGDVSSGSSSSSWSAGLSVNLSVSAGRESDLAAQLLRAEIDIEREKLAALEDATTLIIRSRYQQYLASIESLAQVERLVERTRESFDLIRERFKDGRQTKTELMEAEAVLERAMYQLEKARLATVKNALLVAASASYIDDLIQGKEGE